MVFCAEEQIMKLYDEITNRASAEFNVRDDTTVL